MTKFNRISADAFKSIQKGAGNVLSTFDPTGATAIEDDDIICATSGGVNVTCTPTYVNLFDDIDNAPTNTKEGNTIDGWAVGMSFTALNCTTDVIKLALGAADIGSTDTTKVTPRTALKDADYSDVWWVGETLDGGFCAVKMLNALSSGGMSLQTNDGGKGQISVSLSGYVSLSDPDTVPMEFYVVKGA